jgi:hypothetical protein
MDSKYRSISQQFNRIFLNLSSDVRTILETHSQDELVRMTSAKNFIMRWFIIQLYLVPDFDTIGTILDFTIYAIPNVVNLIGHFAETQEIWVYNSLLGLNFMLYDMFRKKLLTKEFHDEICRYLGCWQENVELMLMAKNYAHDDVMQLRIAFVNSQRGRSVTLPYKVKSGSPLRKAPVRIVNNAGSSTSVVLKKRN